MTYKPVLLIAALLVSGCMGSSVQDPGAGEPPPESCLSFNSPVANIYVRGATDNSVIENATVTVNVIGESTAASHEATYIRGDDGLANSEMGAYFTEIGLNEPNYLINVAVTAAGYQDYLSEDTEFVVNTSCQAENNFNYAVQLCQEGSLCEQGTG